MINYSTCLLYNLKSQYIHTDNMFRFHHTSLIYFIINIFSIIFSLTSDAVILESQHLPADATYTKKYYESISSTHTFPSKGLCSTICKSGLIIDNLYIKYNVNNMTEVSKNNIKQLIPDCQSVINTLANKHNYHNATLFGRHRGPSIIKPRNLRKTTKTAKTKTSCFSFLKPNLVSPPGRVYIAYEQAEWESKYTTSTSNLTITDTQTIPSVEDNSVSKHLIDHLYKSQNCSIEIPSSPTLSKSEQNLFTNTQIVIPTTSYFTVFPTDEFEEKTDNEKHRKGDIVYIFPLLDMEIIQHFNTSIEQAIVEAYTAAKKLNTEVIDESYDENLKTYYTKLAFIYWLYLHISPVKMGTALIADLIIRVISGSCDIPLPDWHNNSSIHFMTWLTPQLNDFTEQYLSQIFETVSKDPEDQSQADTEISDTDVKLPYIREVHDSTISTANSEYLLEWDSDWESGSDSPWDSKQRNLEILTLSVNNLESGFYVELYDSNNTSEREDNIDPHYLTSSFQKKDFITFTLYRETISPCYSCNKKIGQYHFQNPDITSKNQYPTLCKNCLTKQDDDFIKKYKDNYSNVKDLDITLHMTLNELICKCLKCEEYIKNIINLKNHTCQKIEKQL